MYDRIQETESQKDVLKPEEATDWIRSSLSGNITKKDLDGQRNIEINSSDFLQS